MNLLLKLKYAILNFGSIFKSHIVELSVMLLFTILQLDIFDINIYSRILPVCALFSFTLNNVYSQGEKRLIYYLSWIPFLILSFIPGIYNLISDQNYVIILSVLSPLFLLIFTKDRDTYRFLLNFFRYVYSFILSILITSILALIIVITVTSVLYIFFNLKKQIENDLILNIVKFLYYFIAPSFFCYFNRETEDIDIIKVNKFRNLVVNYIISPALIIYAIILYAYIFFILLNGELPKGKVASMVLGFTLFGIITKALNLFFGEKKYKLFFNNLGLICIPPMIMFWFGVQRRILDYGMTEDRVYLVLLGIIISISIIVFLFKKINYYYIISLVSFILFSVTVFIPYFSASEISYRSQYNRILIAANKIGILDADNNFIKERRPLSDTIYTDDYYKIHNSLKVLTRSEYKNKHVFGLNSSDEIFNISPIKVQEIINSKRGYSEGGFINIKSGNCEYETSGYKSIYTYSEGYYNIIEDTINITLKDSVIYSQGKGDFLKDIFNNADIDSQNISELRYNTSKCNLFVENKDYKIILESIYFDKDKLILTGFEVCFILQKKSE